MCVIISKQITSKVLGKTVAEKPKGKIIAQNKKAYHDYFVIETFEAGIALRTGRSCSMETAFAGNLIVAFPGLLWCSPTRPLEAKSTASLSSE